MNKYLSALPYIVLFLGVAYVGIKAAKPLSSENEVNYAALGEIPIADAGRFKPLSSLVETSLYIISGRHEVVTEDGKRIPAMRWFVDVFDTTKFHFFSGPAAKYKIFRIENEDILKLLHLPKRPQFFRYSLEEIQTYYDDFERAVDKASELQEKIKERKVIVSQPDRVRAEKILELSEKLTVYSKLLRRIPSPGDEKKPYRILPPQQENQEWQSLVDIDMQVRNFTKEEEEQINNNRLNYVQNILSATGIKDPNQLTPKQQALLKQKLVEYSNNYQLLEIAPNHRADISPLAAELTKIFQLAKEGNPECNSLLKNFKDSYYHTIPERQMFRIKLETILNRTNVFYYVIMLNIWVILLAATSWLVWQEPLRRSAVYLAIFCLVLETIGIVMRIWISGRPPVFNLYSSSIFISAGCGATCLVLEYLFPRALGVFWAGVMGAITNYVAHNILTLSGDPLEVVQAVLDTNFWLAVHVTTVSMGYVATLVSGGLGLIYIARGVFTPGFVKPAQKELTQMIYGTVCFALLLSFFGTVAGGIWADQSWGRFWGWDPKENGAVLVVCWNALILHARWCGMVRSRGLAVLSLMGNMVTVFSWFGTNQLGVGLHSYGFSKDLVELCKWVWLSHLCFIGIGCIPIRYWSSAPHFLSRSANATASSPENKSLTSLDQKEKKRHPQVQV